MRDEFDNFLNKSNNIYLDCALEGPSLLLDYGSVKILKRLCKRLFSFSSIVKSSYTENNISLN